MVNLQFGNYEQFKNFFMNADNSVRNILKNVYPQWASRIQNDYSNGIKMLENKINNIIPSTSGALNKVKDFTQKTGATAKNITNKVGGFKPSKLGTVGAALTIADPNTKWNEKILGAGLVSPQIAPYALAGLAATQLGPRYINSYYDNKLNKDTRYSDDVFDNYLNNNLAPELKPLTPEQDLKLMNYLNTQQGKAIDDMQLDLDEAMAYNNDEINAWDNLINNGPSFNSQLPPLGNLQFDSNFNSSLPPVPIQNAQNAREGGLNTYQDSLYPLRGISQYRASQAPLDGLANKPDYRTYQAGLNMDINDFLSAMGKANKEEALAQRDYTDSYKALLGLLGDYNTTEKLRRENAQELLKEYENALGRDRMANSANQLANVLSIGGIKAPVSYVSAKGNLNQIALDQPNRYAYFPTNTTNNQQAFANRLKINEQLQPKQNSMLKDILVAGAIGDRYNIDPLAFLNSDYGKEILKNMGTIENTRATGDERRKDIAPNTLSNLIEKRQDNINNMMLEDVKGAYDIYLQQLKDIGLNNRQASQVASQMAIAEYAQQAQTYRSIFGDTNDWEKAKLSSQTQKDVANIYAGRNKSGSNSDLGDMLKMAQIAQILDSIPDPVKRQQYYNMVFPNGVPVIGSPTMDTMNISPSQYGTTINQQQILERARDRR